MNAYLTQRPGRRRRGFSLVELLVVLGIMATIAGIGIFATRPFQSRSAVNNGAVLLQSWLTVAKQRAMAYQRPCGLRLLPGDEIADNNGTNISQLVTKCVYIQQQDDYFGTGIWHGTKTPAYPDPNNYIKKWETLAEVLTTATPLSVTIASDDKAYIEINGGAIYSISSANINSNTITLNKRYPLPLSKLGTTGTEPGNATYRIYRTTAALTNKTDINDLATEEILRMPRGSAINVKANVRFLVSDGGRPPNPGTGLTPPDPPIDIVFGPDGSVSVPAVNSDKIMLWVTGTQKSADGTVDALQGGPALVVVTTRTGYVAGYNVETAPTKSPYSQVP